MRLFYGQKILLQNTATEPLLSMRIQYINSVCYCNQKMQVPKNCKAIVPLHEQSYAVIDNYS